MGAMVSASTVHRVQKPWGYELIWAVTDRYVGKILHIERGQQLSLQYHREKLESFFLYSGVMRFIYEDEEGNMHDVVMRCGQAHHVPARRKHRMIALEDCDVFEVSTPQLDDVVRLEDSYGRAGS
jgi:mannose-6-phosphate isomerase-like protein (cupin superfamily)